MYKDFEELASTVDDKVVVQTTLGELRSSLGYDRLGRYVLGQIIEELEGRNLGYFPLAVLESNDEPRQAHEVRVYKRNSEAGKIIRAVTHPTPGGDQFLVQSVGSDAETRLAKVRALVCE